MIYVNCKADNQTFVNLTCYLDMELAQRYGIGQVQYDGYNRIVNAEAIIAMDDKLAAGCGCIRSFAGETAEIKRMYVKPEYRGRGIAKELLKRLENRAMELGYKTAILETGCKQPEAIRLYEKSGYEHIPNYGPYTDMLDSVCFKKRLQTTK